MEYFLEHGFTISPEVTSFSLNVNAASFLQNVWVADNNIMAIMNVVYILSLFFVVALCVSIFFNRGPLATIGVLAYILSLATMTLTVKSVFVHQKFNYPKFVTATHFICCGIVCFGIMMYRDRTGKKKMVVPTMEQMWKTITPISLSFAASVGANNDALLYCNAAFAEMIGGAAPLFVIGIEVFEGKAFDAKLLTPVIAVIVGVGMCAKGELSFTWLGFTLISTATFLRAFKSNLQQKMLGHQQSSDNFQLEPIELLAWMSPPCLALMIVWGAVTEGSEPFTQLSWPSTVAVLVTCVNACVLNVANNFVIHDLGAVGCMLAGQLKGILLLMGAVVHLGEVIQAAQVVGYVFIAGGVYFYNKMDKEIKEAKAHEKDVESFQETFPLRA